MAALRVPFAVGSGGFLSLSLFYVLWMFVATPASFGPVFKPKPYIFTKAREQTTPVFKRDPKVEREPPVFVPEGPRFGGVDRGDVGGGTAFVPPDVDAGVVIGGDFGYGSDREAVPLVRITPDYPPGPIRTNTEGWVQVQFSITTGGAVRDAFVVAARADERVRRRRAQGDRALALPAAGSGRRRDRTRRPADNHPFRPRRGLSLLEPSIHGTSE